MFEFDILMNVKFLIYRGVFLIVNSFFDLLGFFFFVVICLNWDEFLLEYILISWEMWSLMLKILEDIYIL